MTAEFANRRLREVGGVSRNRLLVDKMIVWRAISGLIVASKWPAPEPQSACRFSTTDAKGLVINANKLPRCALLRQESPPRFHKVGDWTSATYDYAADCQGFSRGVVAELNRKDWAVGRGFPSTRGSVRDVHWLNIAFLIVAGLLVWRFLKMGRPLSSQLSPCHSKHNLPDQLHVRPSSDRSGIA
jgi:hypothetical protein